MLLKGGEVITVNENSDVYTGGCVGITDGKIDYAGPYKEGLEDRYDKVYDCRGKAVMPGFVNCHNHASMVLFRNYADDLKLMDWLFKKIFPLEDKLDDDMTYWASSLAIMEMIKGGTAAFCDMYFFMESTAKAVCESGIRAALSRGLSGESGDDMDYRLKENIELYQKYNNACGGKLKIMLGPHSVFTCSKPYLEKVGRVSREYGIPIHVHISETKDEVKGCREKYGISPVKLLYDADILKESTVAAHCVVVDDDDIGMLKEKEVNVVHNPNSNMKLASGIAPVTRMMESGINVCIGTDGASSNNNLDMLEEMHSAALLQKVATCDPLALPSFEALKMATSSGATALALPDVGLLKAGMKADLILVDFHRPHLYPQHDLIAHLVYAAQSADVDTVIIHGEVVMEGRRVLTMDEEEVMLEAQQRAIRLVGEK